MKITWRKKLWIGLTLAVGAFLLFSVHESSKLVGFTDTVDQMEEKLRPDMTYEEAVTAFGRPIGVSGDIHISSVAHWYAWDGVLLVKFSDNRVEKWHKHPENRQPFHWQWLRFRQRISS
jgi:hypothetical protein